MIVAQTMVITSVYEGIAITTNDKQYSNNNNNNNNSIIDHGGKEITRDVAIKCMVKEPPRIAKKLVVAASTSQRSSKTSP